MHLEGRLLFTSDDATWNPSVRNEGTIEDVRNATHNPHTQGNLQRKISSLKDYRPSLETKVMTASLYLYISSSQKIALSKKEMNANCKCRIFIPT